jgi:hypothetical protein
MSYRVLPFLDPLNIILYSCVVDNVRIVDDCPQQRQDISGPSKKEGRLHIRFDFDVSMDTAKRRGQSTQTIVDDGTQELQWSCYESKTTLQTTPLRHISVMLINHSWHGCTCGRRKEQQMVESDDVADPLCKWKNLCWLSPQG